MKHLVPFALFAVSFAALLLLLPPESRADNATNANVLDISSTLENISHESAETLQSETFSVVLNPRKEAVLSAEIESTIMSIGKEFGQTFKKGEVLIRLDSKLYAWRQDKARAMYKKAAEAFKVIEHLYKNKSRSIIELEEARAELAVARANLNITGQEQSFCTIKAPYSGRVEKELVNEREWVEAGTPLIKIVSDSTLLARTLVPWSCLDAFPVGKKVDIVLYNRQTASGTVSHVSAVMDSVSRTFEVNIEVPNPDKKLTCGMTGHISMPEPESATGPTGSAAQ